MVWLQFSLGWLFYDVTISWFGLPRWLICCWLTFRLLVIVVVGSLCCLLWFYFCVFDLNRSVLTFDLVFIVVIRYMHGIYVVLDYLDKFVWLVYFYLFGVCFRFWLFVLFCFLGFVLLFCGLLLELIELFGCIIWFVWLFIIVGFGCLCVNWLFELLCLILVCVVCFDCVHCFGVFWFLMDLLFWRLLVGLFVVFTLVVVYLWFCDWDVVIILGFGFV